MKSDKKLESFKLMPNNVALYLPPIVWKGDPKGHVGIYDAFFYVVSGECYILIEDECIILKAGELAFLPKGKMRTYSAIPSSLTMYEIDFDAEINGKYWYGEMNMKKDYYSVKVPDPDLFSRLFEESIRHEQDKDIMYDVLCSSNLARIISSYISLSSEVEHKESPFSQVIKFMRDNLEKQLRVEILAESACMETTYFIKKFKAAVGATPIEYLNKLRIYKAMTYLASTNMTVESIGREVGIVDNSYFSRMFRKYCAVTPTEYREIFSSGH